MSFVAISIGAVPTRASAVTYDDYATSLPHPLPTGGVSGFHFQYDDRNDDHLFAIGELVPGTFTAFVFTSTPLPDTPPALLWAPEGEVKYQVPYWQIPLSLDLIYAPPYNFCPLNEAFVLVESTKGGPEPVKYMEPPWEWRFSGPDGLVVVAPHGYTCTQSVVPLPPSVLLLGSGLQGLAGWRRFRKG